MVIKGYLCWYDIYMYIQVKLKIKSSFPGCLWAAACGGGPHRGDGGWQVSCMCLLSDSSILDPLLDFVFVFFPFSLEVMGEFEVNEWRDTVQLYQEQVRLCWVEERAAWAPPWLNMSSAMLQKTQLHFYLFEGLRYVWLDRKGAFCRVRYWNCYWSSIFRWNLLKLDPRKKNTKQTLEIRWHTCCCKLKNNQNFDFNKRRLYFLIFCAVSSMRTGPVRICTASKRAWVTLSRAWGRKCCRNMKHKVMV